MSAFYDAVAANKPNTGWGHTDAVAGVTYIESYLNNTLQHIWNSPSSRPLGFFQAPKSPCVYIKCKKGSYCVGTDKIGHFFQQGHMLYEIGNALGNDYADAFSLWSEGVYDDPDFAVPNPNVLNPSVAQWLENGQFDFYEDGLQPIAGYESYWGGSLVPSTPADLAANAAGHAFWNQLGPGSTFDICDHVSEAWMEKPQSDWVSK